MEYREDIEQLVKSTFDNFEADVHPDAWMNIQNGLNVPVSNPGVSANNVAAGAKVAAVSSKFIIMAVTAIVGITTAVIYFSSDNKTVENAPVKEIKSVQNALPVVDSKEIENKNFSEKANVKKEELPVASNKTIVDKNVNQQTSKENSSYLSSTNDDVAPVAMDKKNAETVSDEKNKDPEIKLPGNTIRTTPLLTDDQQNKNEGAIQDVPSGPDTQEGINNALPKKEEEKAIEEYLGEIHDPITPNGDGKNDAFVIEGKDLKTLSVSIVDRSGKIIHQWNNLHGFWDGKLDNGEPAPAGVYFYNILGQTNTGKLLNKKGVINLILK